MLLVITNICSSYTAHYNNGSNVHDKKVWSNSSVNIGHDDYPFLPDARNIVVMGHLGNIQISK